jgi:Zn-dependent peptidase ImmA (M78 family)
MIKPDDRTLTPEDLRIIEKRARDILNRAAAWNRFPTPVEDILAAARLKVAPHSIFDVKGIMAYLEEKAITAGRAIMSTGRKIKSALSKVWGLYDANLYEIHIDETVLPVKQTFLKLHETGHHEIPAHRKIFRLFQDCKRTLAPETADLFDREANNFARCVLFQGDTFAQMATDYPFEMKTPKKLAKKFGASIYASVREYARTSSRACVVYALEKLEFVEGSGAKAEVRRIEPSPTFMEQFGEPRDTVITLDHPLGRVLPIYSKVKGPLSLSIVDLNGTTHECVAEGFKTPYNVFILLYPVRALTASMIIMPRGFQKRVGLVGGSVS